MQCQYRRHHLLGALLALFAVPALAQQPTLADLGARRETCLTHRHKAIVGLDHPSTAHVEITYDQGFEGCPADEKAYQDAARNAWEKEKGMTMDQWLKKHRPAFLNDHLPQ